MIGAGFADAIGAMLIKSLAWIAVAVIMLGAVAGAAIVVLA